MKWLDYDTALDPDDWQLVGQNPPPKATGADLEGTGATALEVYLDEWR